VPARLKQERDVLALKLGGDEDEFQRQKAAAKTIAGYRWNPENKTWDYMDTDDTLLDIMRKVEPDMTKPLEERVQAVAASKAEELVTVLPDDATLALPWRNRLAPKQRSGVDFMVREGGHAILADDMGGGKTVESIATVHEYAIRTGDPAELPPPRVLVVALNDAATGHWQREIRKWADEDSSIITGGPRDRTGELAASKNWTIITWSKLTLMVDELRKVKWDAIIADEAHFAKNVDSKRTKALLKLRAPVQLAVTGTPVMNNPGELFPLLKWGWPEQYTSFWGFFYKFTEYYEGARNRKVITGVKNPDALRFELANKLVRRTKREIHPDIPEPFDPIIYEPPMKKDQEKLYKEAVDNFWLEVAQEVTEEDRAGMLTAVEKGDLQTAMLMIPNAAARTTRLRQIATSPYLLGGPDESGKLDEIERLVHDGGKGRPWVWFAWYRDTVDLLVERFNAMGHPARGFKGGDNTADDLAQQFQAGEFDIICCTIKSGGQSIEFYRASDCGFAEEDWVPGINQQAFDRIDRKGQTTRPQRHIMRTPGTVETGRIAPTLGTKNLIIDTILGGRS